MLILLWIVVALIIAVKATTLVAGERAHETLDVLLTTPMKSSDIVRQKFRGVTRLMWVLSIPLVTCILLKLAIVTAGGSIRSYGPYKEANWILYITCALLEVAIYLPLVAWVSLFVGMRVRNQSKAIFVTLAVIVAWCALPIFTCIMIFEVLGWHSGLSQLWLLLSPAMIIPFNEFFDLDHFELEWLAVILNFLLYGFVLFVVRTLCLINLDQRLGRASGSLS